MNKKIFSSHFTLFILLFFNNFSLKSQINFTKIPKDLQLFARDKTNKSTVEISGSLIESQHIKLSLSVKKDEKPYTYKTINLPTNYSTPYNFNLNTIIEALPAEYTFQVYLHKKTGDSTLIAKRERVVCGDFYVLYGQSNMKALANLDEILLNMDDRLLRNLDYADENQHTNLTWYSAKYPYASVGGFGLRLQNKIISQYGIPTCIINGAKGGAGLEQLIERNPNNPAQINNLYGQLLNRVNEAGAGGKIKGFIWRQGETDICSDNATILKYPENFNKFFNSLISDFGSMRFYNIQLAMTQCTMLESAGFLRDFIRQTKYLYNNIETSTAIGIQTTDGFHHTSENYAKIVNELFPLIARDIYGLNQNIDNINHPDIQKVYKSTKGDTLTLIFDKLQKMVYPEDRIVNNKNYSMKDFFYINSTTDHNNYLVEKGWAIDNRIYLKLKQPINSGFLTYLPSFLNEYPPNLPIYLTNIKELAAMSFYNFSIASKIPSPTITGTIAKNNTVNLVFNNSPDSAIIERRTDLEVNFTKIATIKNNMYSEVLEESKLSKKVFYRIKHINALSESDYSNIVELIPNIILAEESALFREAIKIYPNPSDGQLTIENLPLQENIFIKIFNHQGKILKAFELSSPTKKQSLQLPPNIKGDVLINIQSKHGNTSKRIFIQ